MIEYFYGEEVYFISLGSYMPILSTEKLEYPQYSVGFFVGKKIIIFLNPVISMGCNVGYNP